MHDIRGIRTMVLVLGTLGAGGLSAQTTPPAPPAATGPGCVSVQLDFDTPARLGQAVRFTLTASNTCAHPVDLILGGQPPYDVVVTDSEDHEVWRFPADGLRQLILAIGRLAGHQQRQFTTDWDQRDRSGRAVAAGNYQVTAVLYGDPPATLAAPTGLLTITP